ncbi:patatin domain-containing protein [Naegleria gruberi]|uniref:Patatin domain-containing protein n=1 Tax=Naegleria gruberi TaxID=5762 RepID=D2VSL8_NAEGR|nr:patatin domain-containing protein [Naegleria gruberi]EFC40212.1 patatin domain-containing protein [Naegleria gruberi]|eukprot:XP_002672956.1 patatin domain-containing protein [Naegleria gruberi strain NEG-M]
MIDPSASPFVPVSPLVAANAFSPRSIPVTSNAFQELDNQGISPVSPRLLRSGSVVALDKKTPSLQSPLKKKAHRRVKSFNLTHAAGVFGSEFDIKCVKVELIMMDIDTYMTKFEPIRIMADRWIRDLDFIKFGVKIFNRIYVWLEDSLVHQFSTDKIDLSDCPTIEFNLSEQPLSKVLDTTCQIINEYNTKQKYSYYNYHSFSFARRVIEKLSGKKLKSKNVLPKTLVKYYREYRDIEKKKKEKEEKEEKEHAKVSNSAPSPATPNEQGKEGDEFDDATPTCKENLPFTPEDYLDLLIEEERNRDTNFIYYVPKRLILKKYRKFHQKQEIKNHTYLLNLINSLLEQCPKFKEEYKFDYLILKTLDRKFWLEKYLQEKYDPVKQKCKFFHKEGTKIHFAEPIYLRDLLKERIHRRRKLFNVKIEDEQVGLEESPIWKNDNDNIITNFSKHREEKKGKTVKVLSMDGGGMKGLILIEILKVIEERVGKKICEIFDIVAGTSTGGIVALLINGGVPMKLAKEYYIDIGKNIFDLKTTHNKSLVKTMKVLRGRSWYDGYHLEMTSMNLTQDVDLNTLHKKKPFTFLVSTMDKSSNPKMNLDEPTAFVFRTYSDPYDYTEESESSSLTSSSKKQPSFYRGTSTGAGITAMDVIRATSAAPMYFKPRVIGDSEFIDGAVVANNPIQLSMYEAKQIFPNHDKFVFVSLGTGALSGKNSEEDGDEEVNLNLSPQGTNTKPRKKSIMKAFKGISQTLNTLLSVVNLQLSSDRIHKMATAQLEFFKEGKSLCEYFRLNVPGLGDKGLDEVDDELFALFEKDTVAYMENHPDLDRLCQLLKME